MTVPRRRVLAAFSTCLVGAALALPTPAGATTSASALATSKANAVSYVKGLQASDGSFVTSGLSNEWAFSALAAAGVAAVDVTPGGNAANNARTVYQGQVAASTWPGTSPVVTDYERGLLNTYAAGIDPARVSTNRNLEADVLSYWQPSAPGYFGTPANFNGTVFALLALAGAKTQAGAQRVPQSLLNASIAVVRANEHNDGGWDFAQAAGQSSKLAATSDIVMTAATSTLGAVLDAAAGSSTPSGLVTSSAPSGASGAITSINGVANANGKTWKVGIDGSTPVTADRGTVVHLGDTIVLQFS